MRLWLLAALVLVVALRFWRATPQDDDSRAAQGLLPEEDPFIARYYSVEDFEDGS